MTFSRLPLLALLPFLFACNSAQSEIDSSCEHGPTHLRCVKYLKNYDGDTVTVNVPGVHPLLGKEISVRIHGIDTPEKSGKKPCEKERAREAQRLVENLLSRAGNIELRNIARDKYFRILADVYADGKSLSEALLKNKLAYPYDGGRKMASVNWCRN
jgi:micrococcal nuclease